MFAIKIVEKSWWYYIEKINENKKINLIEVKWLIFQSSLVSVKIVWLYKLFRMSKSYDYHIVGNIGPGSSSMASKKLPFRSFVETKGRYTDQKAGM